MNELPFLVTQIMNLHFGRVPVVAVNLSVGGCWLPIAFHSDFRSKFNTRGY
jgi:hypothetical protein